MWANLRSNEVLSIWRYNLQRGSCNMLWVCCLSYKFLATPALFFPGVMTHPKQQQQKKLHYKTIRSEGSCDAAGIRRSLPTASVWEGQWCRGGRGSVVWVTDQHTQHFPGVNFFQWKICFCLCVSDQLWLAVCVLKNRSLPSQSHPRTLSLSHTKFPQCCSVLILPPILANHMHQRVCGWFTGVFLF